MSIKKVVLLVSVCLLFSIGCQSTSSPAVLSISTLTAVPTFTAVPATPASAPTAASGPAVDSAALTLAQKGVSSNSQWMPVEQDFDGVRMVLVPAGCFQMGNDQGSQDEMPASQQCFKQPFWLDRTEVTNAQFSKFNSKASTASKWTADNLPREQITWAEANALCALRGARVPTEAEWEYAARGPDDLIYPWGNNFIAADVVWQSHQPAEVGSIPAGASWVGALDMLGNVWEWTNSINKPYPYDATDGRESNGSAGPSVQHILRGGSFGARAVDQGLLHSSFRSAPPLNFSSPDVGFRCARSYQ